MIPYGESTIIAVDGLEYPALCRFVHCGPNSMLVFALYAMGSRMGANGTIATDTRCPWALGCFTTEIVQDDEAWALQHKLVYAETHDDWSAFLRDRGSTGVPVEIVMLKLMIDAGFFGSDMRDTASQ